MKKRWFLSNSHQYLYNVFLKKKLFYRGWSFLFIAPRAEDDFSLFAFSIFISILLLFLLSRGRINHLCHIRRRLLSVDSISISISRVLYKLTAQHSSRFATCRCHRVLNDWRRGNGKDGPPRKIGKKLRHCC